MTDNDETLIQEVNERLRYDQQMALLKRYGPWLGALFVALLIGVGGWVWFQSWRTESSRAQADKLFAVQEKARAGDASAAAEFEALSNEGPQIYRVMAMMEQAGALEAAGDLDGARAAFDAAAEAARDPLLRDSARLRAAYIVADTQDFPALRTRLQPLIDGGGRLSLLARELLAMEAWEAGEEALARETLENLNLAFDAPESMRQRVAFALAVLGPAPEAAEGADAPQPSTGEPQ